MVLELLHPRGGRLVQVAVRGPTGPVVVHAARVKRTLVKLVRVGRFHLGDPVLVWACDASALTIEEDGVIEPWRAWGAHVSDSLVKHLAMWTLTTQDDITHRSIGLWVLGRRSDGKIQEMIPAWK